MRELLNDSFTSFVGKTSQLDAQWLLLKMALTFPWRPGSVHIWERASSHARHIWLPVNARCLMSVSTYTQLPRNLLV